MTHIYAAMAANIQRALEQPDATIRPYLQGLKQCYESLAGVTGWIDEQQQVDMVRTPIKETNYDIPPHAGEVFFPHDVENAGRGTFTPEPPTDAEAMEALRRRFGGGNNE